MQRPKAYLAGPLGFSEAGRFFHFTVLVSMVTEVGFEVLDPWVLARITKLSEVVDMPYGQAKRDAWRQINRQLGEINTAAIRSCDIVIAVLDGVDIDSGTAAEIGFAAALGKTIVGYRGDFRLSSDNEGCTVNLQVQHFIEELGRGRIVQTINELKAFLQKYACSRQDSALSLEA